jgi:integrase
MINRIEQYLNEHEKAWSQSTLRSERYRLQAVSHVLGSGPDALWACLEERGIKPYSRVTYWTRVTDFYEWCISKGLEQSPNPYRKWRDENALQFKHTYERKQPSITYNEARARIESIRDRDIREACLLLLEGALRYCELRTFSPTDRTVTGKGSKPRRIYADGKRYTGSYDRIRGALKSLELRPHDLRKLGATRFASLGLREEDLCKVMGWNSIETALSYLQPKKEEEIESLIKQHVS